LNLPAVSREGKDAEAHFGWFSYFASLNCAASSEQTSKILGWFPTRPGLLDELVPGVYF
jgi:hypothetical protein